MNFLKKLLYLECMFECSHLVQDTAQGPDVRLVVVGLVLANFGARI
jgi:hypothetical protein